MIAVVLCAGCSRTTTPRRDEPRHERYAKTAPTTTTTNSTTPTTITGTTQPAEPATGTVVSDFSHFVVLELHDSLGPPQSSSSEHVSPTQSLRHTLARVPRLQQYLDE
ncbi:Hypothetical predicted protein [Paramuricea clavata]|uniref:Uncharacterized protein n=1 Tax=Paramuricea clavata TaxID=317549 RepID=A0A6S7IP59_PARCT|nr:Hypothetical predicted protein [Paramuricea clavata]